MRFGKKLSWLTLPSLLCLFSLLLTACGGGSVPSGSGSTVKAPASQQIYRWGLNLPDITSFDPGTVTDSPSIQAVNLVFTGLVQLDDNLNVKPQLASSYNVSSDGLTYTFHLRPNLKFSDGTKLDANDVAYSVDRALSPSVNNVSGAALTYLGNLKDATARTTGAVKSLIGDSIIVPNPNTIVFKLSNPSAYFLQALTYPVSYVVEKSVVEKWGLSSWTDHLSDNGGQGGDGPFKVKAYSHTTGIQFVPNPNYYGPKPQLAELDYVPYKDTQTEYNAYLANQIDFTNIPLPQVAAAKKSPDFSQTPALTIFYIGMNSRVKPLDNQDIRQAMALAINRNAIVQGVYGNAYTPTCHIVPQGQYGYDPNLQCPGGATTAGDKAKAVALFNEGLAQTGATRADFSRITFTYPSQNANAANEVAAETQMWKSVLGINVATTTVSQSNLFKQLSLNNGKAGPLQIWISGWGADFPDPEDWISLQFAPNQANNAVNFGQNDSAQVKQQQAAQAEMAKADLMHGTSAADLAARAKAYNQIEQQLVNYAAWIPIYQRPDLRLTKPWVHGLTFTSDSSTPPNDWAKVYITKH
ncbi:peptide ABC transporter substrate-binding protein [Ktedonobacteria bacterium brp13]|nr:peptide ABC transporter substrate-binding protein [Ktedonobacteria bacterium brp13]